MAACISRLLVVFVVSVLLRASQIEDCCCDTETVSENNQEFLNEILTVLRKRTFFRIFKVDIYKPCKLWPDNTLCFKPTCSVTQCCEEDIPQKWRAMEKAQAYNMPVDLFVSDTFDHWNNVDEDQWVSHSANQDQMIYIDLERNQDGYTGYKGEEAGRIWRAIYEAKNLLYRNVDDKSKHLYEREDRVLYRLLSGFHTLTTCMVFANWPLPDNPQEYGPNLQLYEKVLHGHQDWIQNLYFGFVFLLRAINKASTMLKEYDMNTGNAADDAMTMGLMLYLLQTDFIRTQCNHLNSFDESMMFQEERLLIRDNFRNVFRNISEIIDCVGCEKCKLHAKVEVLGLGTALKVLFTKDILSADMFERNEILALIVTLGKYSDAIQFIEEMERQIEVNKMKANIQGYVDIDNERKEREQQDQLQEAHMNQQQEFEGLIDKTFRHLFENDTMDGCEEWKSFCTASDDHGRSEDAQKQQIAISICDLYQEFCAKS